MSNDELKRMGFSESVYAGKGFALRWIDTVGAIAFTVPNEAGIALYHRANGRLTPGDISALIDRLEGRKEVPHEPVQ